MSGCNGCGGCCNPVTLPYTQDTLRRLLPGQWRHAGLDDRDVHHVLHDLTPLTRREGRRRAPWIGAGTVGSDPRAGVVIMDTNFYECRHYDAETRQCTNYENRPPMCADYPWYGDPPDAAKALPPECSYLEDIPVHVRESVKRRIAAGTYYRVDP